MDQFFDLVAADKAKIRIMFTQNYFRAVGLDAHHLEHGFFLLYYQFIKHAFGLTFSNDGRVPISVRVYFDRLPDTKEKGEMFKDYIAGLNRNRQFRQAGVRIARDQIAEIDSKKHDLLQCVDVVLGAMQFRLNDKHLVKPQGKARRAKRTIAKEKLYKHINQRIRKIYPGFNVGISTGQAGDPSSRWSHPYRHWCFRPKAARIDETAAKGKK